MKALMRFRELVHRCARAVDFLPTVLARLTVGIVFAESGWGKLNNLSQVTAFFTDLGIPFAAAQAPFVAATELVCGILVLVGCFTRVAAVPLAFTMVVAILTAKRAQLGGLTDIFGFTEFLYIVLCTYLFVEGGGRFSVDAILRKKFSGSGIGGNTRHMRAA